MKAAIVSLGSESSLMTITAMKKYFDRVDDIRLKDIEVELKNEGLDVLHLGKPLEDYDCVYIKGSFRYTQMLQSLTIALKGRCYLPVSSNAITVSNDKLLTQLELQKNNIPMPMTFIAATPEAGKQVLERVNYPIVMKFPQGTQGKGVMFADSYSSASSMLDALSTLKQSFIIQEFIDTQGKDIRAFVVGDEVVGAVKRTAKEGEKRANVHAGSVGEIIHLSYEDQRIAIKTAKTVGAEICAVDLLKGVKGALVLEVNTSPGIRGFMKTTGINIPDKIAKYLFKKSSEFSGSRTAHKKNKIFSDLGISEIQKGEQEIITHLDYRGSRILLPEIVSKSSSFDEMQEVIIRVRKDNIQIKKI